MRNYQVSIRVTILTVLLLLISIFSVVFVAANYRKSTEAALWVERGNRLNQHTGIPPLRRPG